MKIRIFALARELGLDSKVLLGLADEAGVALRNALATVSEEERDQIVAYVQNKGKKPTSKAAPQKAVSPSRDATAGKTRDIKVLPPQPGKETSADTETVTPAETSQTDEQPEEVVEPVVEAAATETETADVELEVTADETSDSPTETCLLYTSPSPRDLSTSRMPSSA